MVDRKVFDFSKLQDDIYPEWERQFESGDGVGEYSYAKDGPTSVYGSTDMLISEYILGKAGDLDDEKKDEWASTINQFQEKSTGKFTKKYSLHFWEHTTAYATCALHLIDKKPAHPMKWKESILKRPLKWTKRRKRAPWSLIWSGSHVWSGVPAILVMTGEGTEEFFAWYFNWFDEKVDPSTGFWLRGWKHKIFRKPHKHDMFGAFHMYYVYEYMHKEWLYPEKIVDWTLKFQQDNGFWSGKVTFCADLDGLYCLTRSSRNAGGYREADIKDAVIRYLETAEKTLNDKSFVFEHYPNSHKLTGGLCAIAECQKFYPELVTTSKPLIQSLDKACYI